MQKDRLISHVLNDLLVRELVVLMGTALGKGLRLVENCKNAGPDSESPITFLTSEGLAAFSLGPVNDNHFISITV